MVSTRTQSFLMDFYQIDEEILAELLLIVANATYWVVILASFVYQGGLYLYYGWKWKRLTAAATIKGKLSGIDH